MLKAPVAKCRSDRHRVCRHSMANWHMRKASPGPFSLSKCKGTDVARHAFYVGRWERMTGSLEDEIRKILEQANILAEEARVLEENFDERARAARERARKASERLQTLLQEKPR
jgi:hypothetical protein